MLLPLHQTIPVLIMDIKTPIIIMKVTFQNGSDEPKVAESMIQALNASTGKPANAIIVTFTDNTTANASMKHVNADGTVKFLTEDLTINQALFELSTINGDLWIVEKANRNIKLTK